MGIPPPPGTGPEPKLGRPAPRYRESRQEIAIYIGAGTSLILLGIVLRTALLNWIVGPAFVVTFVVLANRWFGAGRGARR